MNTLNLKEIFDGLKYGEDSFHELMSWRARRVLLVLPHYDAWILGHDAKLSDQIVGEYHQLNLTTVPRLMTVADGEEALDLLQKSKIDLMIVGMRVGKLSSLDLARKAKKIRPDLPILLLHSSRSDLSFWDTQLAKNEELPIGENQEEAEERAVDAQFLWTGDSRLLLAMIKYVEDKRNAPVDAGEKGVGILLVVEDSVAFYSAYLPLLYGEIMTQTQRLIAEGMNDNDRYFRMRTRPKVLLARDWEEAVFLGDHYAKALIGIVSDISFQRKGKLDEHAGFHLIERFRQNGISTPVLFQSSDDSKRTEVRQYDAIFQRKRANDLHRGIRQFLLKDLGFGDFIFRHSDGKEFQRVSTLREFEVVLKTMSSEIILYHGKRDDYSTWMTAHGEYHIARKIKPIRLEDFSDPEEQRAFLIDAFRQVQERRRRGRLIDFNPQDSDALGSLARFGSGSLGGKGRGLAFFNALLRSSSWVNQFAPLQVRVPRSLIIATGEFDYFLEKSGLPPAQYADDSALQDAFLAAPLSQKLQVCLRNFVEIETNPLAVRSSGILEDSQSLPFAGIYETYMLTNKGDLEKRVKELSDALRLVWASTFSREATLYREALGIGREEEKMAVVIQEIAGSSYGNNFMPRLSGTAQSLNYYPIGPMKPEDGVAQIAVGLGPAVVGGERGYFFCPSYPDIPWGSEDDRWREGQTNFWSLQLDGGDKADKTQGLGTLSRHSIRKAEKMGILRHMASTWDTEEGRIVDGIERPGVRVVDFRDILEYEWLPLAQLLEQLLKIAYTAIGAPVELEFALNWKGDVPGNAEFSLLQVRPYVTQTGEKAKLPLPPPMEKLFLNSVKALGHGLIENIYDVIWIDPEKYNALETESLRDEVADLMDSFAKENRFTVLIGPGRWGSRDRFLGIPVSWTQVRQARLIVEVALEIGAPEPSQGSHFFHNLVALGVGYAHIPFHDEESFVDWDWLRSVSKGTGSVLTARFEQSLNIVMDGKKGALWLEKN